MQLKKKFTSYLLAFAVVLLIVNVLVDYFKKSNKGNNYVRELTSHQIDSIFLSVLNQYGIEPEWISTTKIKVPDEDSISKKFIVMLPEDLPIPLIIKDFHKIIENDITSFVSEEKKIYGTTELRIYTNEYLKLLALLIPDKQTVRKRNELSFVISNAFDLNESDFNSFLSIPYNFSAVVIPKEDLILKADSIKKYSKEYIVLLNDDLNDSKFKLNPSSHKEVLRNSIRNIITFFKDAQLFVVDESSELFNSTVYNFIRDEFKKNKKTLIPLSEFIHLNSEEDAELNSRFRFHCEDKSGSNQKIFFLTFENFQKIKNEFDRIRKRGNKITALSSTDLVKNISEFKK